LWRRLTQCRPQCFGTVVRQTIVRGCLTDSPAGTAGLQRTKRLLEGLLERAPDSHGLADGFHLRRETRISRGELLERKPWSLDHDIIEHRLKRCRCGLRDIVPDLVERIHDRQVRADASDRKPGGL